MLHFHLQYLGHLIYKCGGIDKRTIEKFEKASSLSSYFFCVFLFRSYFLVGQAVPALTIAQILLSIKAPEFS